MESFEGLAEIARDLRSGAVNVLLYLETLKKRIEEREPEVRALVSEEGRFQRLKTEAVELLRAWPLPEERPPLFGVPVGVKDIFHAEGFETRAGSALPPEVLAGPEAEVVSRLKAAGALLLGKTVTTEFAYFSPGPTRNPHNPAHTPGGSSSGSAAAVAAGFCPLALGTQTVGSVIRPAAFCGVVGFKPSLGRVSTAGVIPFSPSADHVGWFCRDLTGIGLAASVLVPDWRRATPPLKPRLGIPEGPYLERATPEGLASFRRTVERIREAGFEVEAVPVLDEFAAVAGRHDCLVARDLADVHAEWHGEYRDLYSRRTSSLIGKGKGVDDSLLEQCRASMLELRAALTRAMDEHGLAGWIAPAATGPAPEGLESTGDPVMNLPWTHAGLPAVTIPSDRAANGLPMGLQFVGRHQADETILALAGLVRSRARISLPTS